MNSSDFLILAAIGSASVIAGVISGALIFGLVGGRQYSPRNAIQLLRREQVDEWNEVRTVFSEWQPDLKGLTFDGLRLASVDLQDANLDGCSFQDANLEYALLKGASLVRASLRRAKLKGADFRGATLRKTDFTDVDLNDVIFSQDNPLRKKLDADRLELRTLESLGGAAQLEMLVQHALTRSDRFNIVKAGRGGTHAFPDFLVSARRPDGSTRFLAVELKAREPNNPLSVSAVRPVAAIVDAGAVDGALIITNGDLDRDARVFLAGYPLIQVVDRPMLTDWLMSPFIE